MAGVDVDLGICTHGRKVTEPCPSCPFGMAMNPNGSLQSFQQPSLSRFDNPGLQSGVVMRKFDTGATRNTDENKLDFEGFYSPLVMRRFAAYMHKNRVQADGALRASDNWQKGIPKDAYMKSGFRHFFDWWENHRGVSAVDLEEALCALLFNTQGYLFEILKEKK